MDIKMLNRSNYQPKFKFTTSHLSLAILLITSFNWLTAAVAPAPAPSIFAPDREINPGIQIDLHSIPTGHRPALLAQLGVLGDHPTLRRPRLAEIPPTIDRITWGLPVRTSRVVPDGLLVDTRPTRVFTDPLDALEQRQAGHRLTTEFRELELINNAIDTEIARLRARAVRRRAREAARAALPWWKRYAPRSPWPALSRLTAPWDPLADSDSDRD